MPPFHLLRRPLLRTLALLSLVAGFLILCPALATAEDGGPEDAPLWLRYPAISPDGETIVFTYRGDLYRVPATGGRALPLTVSAAHDFQPVFSPDGKQLAFASDRYGNFDIFVMPSTGGEAKRLTFHSAADRPSDFTPDGNAVLFSSDRLDAPSNSQFPGAGPELYEVPVDGRRPYQRLTTPAIAARFTDSPGEQHSSGEHSSGEHFVYYDHDGYEDPWRKHHTSSVTRDLWFYDGEHHQLTTFPGEDRDPVVVGDSLYYLSEKSGTMNVYRQPFSSHAVGKGTVPEPEALTQFEKHPVRFLSASRDGTLAFSWDGELYTLVPGDEPQRVAVEIVADLRHRRRTVIPVGGDLDEMALAPSGKEMAFVVRGEVFVASLEGTARRVTSTPTQERSVTWHPDGRTLAYAAERDGSWQIYQSSLSREEEKYFWSATVLDEKALLISDADTFQPSYSPTGKEIAFLEDRTELKILDIESGETRTIMPGHMSYSYSDGDQEYAWSPDGRWLLVAYLQPGVWSPELGLVKADGSGEIENVTLSGFNDFAPKFMMKGQVMTWFSNRDGMRAAARTGERQADVYAQFLTREAWDRFRLSKEDFELLKEAEKDDKDGEDSGDEDSGDEDSDDKDKDDEKGEAAKKDRAKKEKKKEIEPIEIEMEGLTDRRARLTIHSSELADAVITPKGEKLLYLARFEKGYDLWSTDLRTRETKVLVKLGARRGTLALDEKGKHVFVLAGGRVRKVEIKSGKAKPIGMKGAELWVDHAAEREYFFEHAWRQVREKFYDPDLHGTDWDFYRSAYERFLPYIDNGHDFAEMLSEMLGELNASHTGAGYRKRDRTGDQTASLGLFFDEEHRGDGLKIVEVLRQGPAAVAGAKIATGDVVEKIDGQAITAGMNYFPLLNRKAGQRVLLSLRNAEDESWEEVVRPITLRERNQLLYKRWVENRRQLTEKLSQGRIGYVHVRAMEDASFRTVYEEVMGRHATKEALVVDTRSNGGGDLVDDLSIFLSGKQYMSFVPPEGGLVGIEPGARWTKPSAMLMGEDNYSDAHCTPWAYKELGIGPLVGMPVPGTCTFVWWELLHDGETVFGIPNMGVVGNDGRALENLQLEPDYLVENEDSEAAKGRDQQLEKAVEVLLKTLEQ